MRRSHRVAVVVVLSLIGATGVVAAAGECLVMLTHGSRWLYGDTVWRYPAFQAHEASFELLTTTPITEVITSFPEQPLTAQERVELSFELDQQVDDALLFHLDGETPGYGGFRGSLTVTDPIGGVYHYSNHISERTLHIDQPVQGTYEISLFADMDGTFSLEVGRGVSPFLTLDLARYTAVFVPDLDQLTAREVEAVRAYLEQGGKLVVISDMIQGASYYTSSNFPALNQLLAPSGIQFTGELLTSSQIVTANNQEITVFDDIVASRITAGVTEVAATGSTLDLAGGATGLVFDEAGEAAIAIAREGLGEYLVVATGIGFNSDFHLSQNDLLASRIVEWATGLRQTVFVAAAASAAGAAGTFWTTDLWLHNRTGVPVVVAAAFLAQRQDNGAAVAAPQELATIPAGGFVAVADVVAALGASGGVGGIYLEATATESTSSADLVSVSSHTWTANPSGAGTYGQGILAIPAGTVDEVRAAGLFVGARYRSNVGVLNTSGSTITVTLEVLDPLGIVTAGASWTLRPYEQRQVSVASLGAPHLDGGTVVLTRTAGVGSFRGYASIVDNDSGDAVYVEAR